jgi:hypothetical protein
VKNESIVMAEKNQKLCGSARCFIAVALAFLGFSLWENLRRTFSCILEQPFNLGNLLLLTGSPCGPYGGRNRPYVL